MSPPKRLMSTLITSGNWNKLRRVLSSSKGLKLLEEKDDSNLNCLAMAVGFNAPVDIVETMLDMNPELAMESDIFGANAMHVACLNGSSCVLIETLLSRCPDLTDTIDNDRRGPLHHAVEYACQYGTTERSYHDVMEALVKVSPRIIYFKDRSGSTPIDLIQYVKSITHPSTDKHRRLHDLYCVLRDVSISLYKKDKRNWEEEGVVDHLDFTSLNIKSGSDQRTATTLTDESWPSTPCQTSDFSCTEVMQNIKYPASDEIARTMDYNNKLGSSHDIKKSKRNIMSMISQKKKDTHWTLDPSRNETIQNNKYSDISIHLGSSSSDSSCRYEFQKESKRRRVKNASSEGSNDNDTRLCHD